MNLKTRAEHFGQEDLEEYKDASKHHVNWILDCIKGETNHPILVCGMRGVGKTLAAMLALQKSEKPGTLIKYQDNKRFEAISFNGAEKYKTIETIFESDNIIIIDDVHYIYDDIRYFGMPPEYLTNLLEMAVNRCKKGKPTIIISEDVFTRNYFEGMGEGAYSEIYEGLTHAGHIQIRADMNEICSFYGIKGTFWEFLRKKETNARGVVRVISCLGGNGWEDLINHTKMRIRNGATDSQLRKYYETLKEEYGGAGSRISIKKIRECIIRDMLDGKTENIDMGWQMIPCDGGYTNKFLSRIKIAGKEFENDSFYFEWYKKSWLGGGYFHNQLVEWAFWEELYEDSSYLDEMKFKAAGVKF